MTVEKVSLYNRNGQFVMGEGATREEAKASAKEQFHALLGKEAEVVRETYEVDDKSQAPGLSFKGRLSHALQALRVERKITQAQAVEKFPASLKVDQGALSRMENGKQAFSSFLVDHLLKAYSVEPIELLGRMSK